jgi:tRNA G18 (ribose-2'-O)-methylase SpoU
MGDTRSALRRQLVVEPNFGSRREQKNREMEKERKRNIAVLLDNIRSAWNVGSILRSADGFGFTHAYLCGITPMADHEAVTKTSLGAEDTVPWSYHKDAVRLVKGLKVEGWKVYALEEDARSLPFSQFPDSRLPNPIALVVGNEVTGVDPELLDLCDRIFYIPMRGEKKSFNVAIAFGIAAYALDVQLPGT